MHPFFFNNLVFGNIKISIIFAVTKQTIMTLEQAIKQIEKKHYSFQLPIQMIEFEDGSGTKFNYRLKGETKNRFIHLQQIK